MAKTISNAVAGRMRDAVRNDEKSRRDFGGARWSTPLTDSVQRMRLKSVDYDYITCRTLDEDGNEGTEDIKVAKPEELQYTTWDKDVCGGAINGIEYNFTGTQARTAVQASPSVTENQVVIPTYQVAGTNYDGAIIYAAKPQGGTGVVDGDDVPVEWQDLNVAGRAWAKVGT